MKYYYREHLLGYERIRAEGKTAWGQIHGAADFDDFASRPFLELALPRLRFPSHPPDALEYGCGTGPGACFLAAAGFRVDAVDLIPAAIEIARDMARRRDLDIRFDVQDICEMPADGKRYDLIVDSFCLQCIVMDDERRRVFATVLARLKPDGYYLVSSAHFDEKRFRPNQVVRDEATGVVYNRYGDRGLIDAGTGIVLAALDERPTGYDHARRIDGTWYLPSRRHLKPSALRDELIAAGLGVLFQDCSHFICARPGSGAGLAD